MFSAAECEMCFLSSDFAPAPGMAVPCVLLLTVLGAEVTSKSSDGLVRIAQPCFCCKLQGILQKARGRGAATGRRYLVVLVGYWEIPEVGLDGFWP